MKKLLKSLFRRLGYSCYNNRFLPWGIILKTDLERLGYPLNQARLILDIGANDGRWLSSVYDIFPQATIHAFEPVPTTYDDLCSKVGQNPRVRTYCQGFSSESKTLSMQIYENPRANSMEAAEIQVGRNPLNTVEVKCATLDAWLKESAIDEIDFIKIDVEGYELKVLNGGINLFREAKAAFVLIEAKSVLSSQVSGPGVSLEQLAGFLDPFGYRLLVLYTRFYSSSAQPYYTNFNAPFARVTPEKSHRPVSPISQAKEVAMT
jgi:FkbM family methyltransferase